jgi:hypothetical protein
MNLLEICDANLIESRLDQNVIGSGNDPAASWRLSDPKGTDPSAAATVHKA